MQDEPVFDWKAALADTYHDFSRQLIEYVPQLLGAIALLVFGWFSAYIVKLAVIKLILSFDVVFKRFSTHSTGSASQLPQTYARIVGKIAFWTILVFFVVAACKMLGWQLFSGWVDRLITYLPSLVTGLFIILAGFIISNGARSAVAGTALSGGLENSQILARTVQIVILFTAVVIGVEQIGIQIGFLTNIMIVVSGVLLAGGSLAFALGARNFVANMIGAQFARKHCKIGDYFTINDLHGELLEITQTTLVLDTAKGRAIIPAKLFQEQISVTAAVKPE